MFDKPKKYPYLFLILLLLTTIFLSSCPNMVVDQINQMIPDSTVKKRYNLRELFKPGISIYDSLKMKEILVLGDSLKAFAKQSDSLGAGKINNIGSEITDSIGRTNMIQAENTGSSDNYVRTEILRFDHSNYPDKIIVYVKVTDNNGRYLRGLAPPEIAPDDNYYDFWNFLSDSCKGSSFRPEKYEVIEITEKNAEPHSICFALDLSPSMGNQKTYRLQNAASKLIKMMKKDDYAAVIKFTKKIRVKVPLTWDREFIKAKFKLDGLKGNYGGGTAIYDAVDRAIDVLDASPVGHRKVVILFSDGVDNSSSKTVDDIQLKAKKKNVTVFTIAYGFAKTEPLEKIAKYTGGKFYQIYSSKLFPYIFADIYMTLKNYYKITYSPPECADKHYVNIGLNMKKFGLGKYKISGEYDKSVFSEADPVGTSYTAIIEFEFGKSDILPESEPIIEEVAASLKKNPNIILEISGHTDNKGTEEFNLELSEKRAEAVKDKLIELGISDGRLKTVGYGESKPIAPNDSEENRKRNRRTEFKITEK